MPRPFHALLALTACVTLSAQSSAPAFDAVSIKPGAVASGSPNVLLSGGRYLGSTTVRSIITFAYQPMVMRQVVGGPGWLDSERYDIHAKAAGNPSGEMLRLMLRSLLVDRFQLRAHVEQRDTQVFALMPARSDGRLGAQVKPSTVDCQARGDDRTPPDTPPQPGTSECAFRTIARSGADGVQIEQIGLGVTMKQFAQTLSALTPVGRLVVDRTSLAGGYDMHFAFSAAGSSINGVQVESSAGASIFTALSEQLGLRLEPITTPVEFLVIDGVERPSPD